MSGLDAEQTSLLLPSLFKAAILAAVYYAAGILSVSLGLVSPAEVLVWPPIGIGLAVLLLHGLQLWPGIFAGAFLLSMRTGFPALGALGVALATTGESLLSAYLLRRYMGLDDLLGTVRDVLALFGIAGVVSPAIGSLAGASSCCLAGLFPWSEFGKIWMSWWRAEVMAIFVVAPAFLTWALNLHLRWTWRKGVEALVLATWLLLGNLLAFGRLSPMANLHFPVLTLPFALRLWAAFRFGPRGATAANLLVVLIAARGTLAGSGPLVGQTVLQSLLFLDAYGISTSAVSMLLAAVVYERKHLEEQLRQAQRMEAIGRLAGGIAHDFNNLLVGILGYGSKLQEELLPDDPRRLKTKYIVQSGLRARELVRQLLVLSRKQPVEVQVLNLNDLLREFGDTLQRLIGEDVELITNLDPELRLMKADPGGITQTIMNLAANARDAMPSGGKLTIQTANFDVIEPKPQRLPEMKPGPYVVLVVSDTGCGMDEATQAHIFEPFFTTKPPGMGSGLGLASVFATVKLSDGHITVSSQPGRGTTFRLYFPCVYETKELSRQFMRGSRTRVVRNNLSSRG